MNPTADLDTSLAFVIGRIEEEAMRSGQLLSDEQRFLLNHLPNNSALPIWNSADPEWPAVLIPRDAAFERLWAVAGAAHNSDARLNPASTLDWEFAVAVLKLNRHPMSWLLRWASMKGAQTLVGPLAPHCCCVAGHNRLHSSDPDRGKRSLDSISMDRHRCRMHCDLDSSAICLTTDRGEAVDANH
jgi:hypothetical protein